MQIRERERERERERFESKKRSSDRKLDEIVREAWTRSYRRKWHTHNRLIILRRKTNFSEGIFFCFFVSFCESRGSWKRSENRCRRRGAFVDASKSSPRGGDACKWATERPGDGGHGVARRSATRTTTPGGHQQPPCPAASNGTSSGTLRSQY